MSRNLSRDLKRTGSRVGRNINIAMRAERLMARRRFSVLQRQTALLALAGLIAGIGVVMLNVGVFFWLSAPLGKAAAGAVLAGVNFALAVALAMFAGRINVEAELQPAMEVRDLALEDIESEVGEALAEARELAEDVRRMARNPLGSIAPGLIGPALSILSKSLKK